MLTVQASPDQNWCYDICQYVVTVWKLNETPANMQHTAPPVHYQV